MGSFARSRSKSYYQYLDPEKQAAHDLERWGHRPDASADVAGNDQRCRKCGAPPGKQCMKADANFRDYPHQARRDDAARWKGFTPDPTLALTQSSETR